MHEVVFYLDFVSPSAWLVFQQLPQTLEGVDCHVRYRPVASEALRKHAGLPAQGAAGAQQAWRLRHGQWLAQQHGLHGVQTRASDAADDAFALLRLAHTCAREGETSRWVTECLFQHVWLPPRHTPHGQRMQALQAQLLHRTEQAPAADDKARAQLRQATQHAIEAGVWDVPALQWQGQWFFGWEGLAMLRSQMQADERQGAR